MRTWDGLMGAVCIYALTVSNDIWHGLLHSGKGFSALVVPVTSDCISLNLQMIHD